MSYKDEYREDIPFFKRGWFKGAVGLWNGAYVPNNMYGPIQVDSTGGIRGR